MALAAIAAWPNATEICESDCTTSPGGVKAGDAALLPGIDFDVARFIAARPEVPRQSASHPHAEADIQCVEF
jgi:hypothetical protein